MVSGEALKKLQEQIAAWPMTQRFVVQQLIEAQFCRRSVRSDLDPAGTLPPFGAIAQVDYDVSFASERRESLLMSWAFYLGTEEEE